MRQKLYILLLLALSCTFTCAWAQDANAYLDKVIEQFQHAKGITADFAMQGEANSGLYMQGTLKMQGKKFYLATNDLTTWYDGKTMWTYAPSIDEVNITTPTRQELAEINPYMLLDDYKQSFMVKELSSSQKGERIFRLTPTKRNTSMSQIVLTIATASNAPISFEITDNNNRKVLIAVTNYNDKVTLPASTFKFDSTQLPYVTVIDLR